MGRPEDKKGLVVVQAPSGSPAPARVSGQPFLLSSASQVKSLTTHQQTQAEIRLIHAPYGSRVLLTLTNGHSGLFELIQRNSTGYTFISPQGREITLQASDISDARLQ